MNYGKPRLPIELSGLTRSDMEALIYEANLGREETELARRYFIDRECQIDIAIEKNTDRTQISRRLGRTRRRLEEVYKKIPS